MDLQECQSSADARFCNSNSTSVCVDLQGVPTLQRNLLLMGYEESYVHDHRCYCFYFKNGKTATRMHRLLQCYIFVAFGHGTCNNIFSYIIPSILALGLVGNTFNFLIFSRQRFMRPTSMYLRCLAVSDQILNLLVWVPLLAKDGWKYLHLGSYSYHFYHSHIRQIITLTFVTCSSYLLVAITIDRYIAICHPRKFRRLVTRNRAFKVCVLCFVLPAILSVPVLMESDMIQFTGGFDEEPSSVRTLYYGTWYPVGRISGKPYPTAYLLYKGFIAGGMFATAHALIIGLTIVNVFEFRKVRRNAMLAPPRVRNITYLGPITVPRTLQHPRNEVEMLTLRPSISSVTREQHVNERKRTAEYTDNNDSKDAGHIVSDGNTTPLDDGDTNMSTRSFNFEGNTVVDSSADVEIPTNAAHTICDDISPCDHHNDCVVDANIKHDTRVETIICVESPRILITPADERRVLIILVATAAMYTVFATPILIVIGTKEILFSGVQIDTQLTTYCVTLLLASCNTSLSFYLYIALLRSVRREFVMLFREFLDRILHLCRGMQS